VVNELIMKIVEKCLNWHFVYLLSIAIYTNNKYLFMYRVYPDL